MEFHLSQLSKLCRCCGKTISYNSGYRNAKLTSDYSDVFLEFSNVNPNVEDQSIYPNKLCISCKIELEKRRKKTITKPLNVKDFQKHADECSICFPANKSSKSKGTFYRELETALTQVGFVKMRNVNKSTKVFYKPKLMESTVSIEFSLNIFTDFRWELFVLDKPLNIDLSPLKEFKILKKENFQQFVNTLNSIHICEGNPDFVDVIEKRVTITKNICAIDGSQIATIENIKGEELEKQNFQVLRDKNCELLIQADTKCVNCKSLRKKLHSIRAVKSPSSDSTSSSSKINYRHQSNEELRQRLANTQAEKQKVVKNLSKLSKKIEKLIKDEEVDVTKEEDILIKEVLSKENPDIPEDTPLFLLWQQQKERASKPSQGMRWHPLIIRWCLSIYTTSPAAYRHIASKRNNFLVLPHVNTLKKYLNYTKPRSGFNPDIIQQLIIDSKLASLNDYEKNVSILFDEMKIQGNLIYRKSSGKIVGFTEMGSLNDELSHFVSRIKSDEKKDPTLAQYVNVFMVRGIFSNLCYPFGYYSSTGFRTDELFPIVWEATSVLESIGFKVRAWVCDGASPNRRFMKINGTQEKFYCVENVFSTDRDIYFFSDVPHLLKTTRNNLENSHGNRNTKNLLIDGYTVSWNHIVSVNEWDLQEHSSVPGLRYLPKLKEEHINLAPRSRMSVKRAAQVISASCAHAMEIQGHPDRRETIRFIRTFDRAFDCLNVVRVDFKGKKDLQPYYTEDDPRFEFLLSVLQYLDMWRNQAENTPGLTPEEKNRLCLSKQTEYGWHLSITSFCHLAKLLFREYPDVKFLLSEKFSQDPLEEHFAKHRRIGGSCDNPSLDQFDRQDVSLNVMNSDLISDLKGNTQGRPDTRPPISIDDTRLPRKAEKRKK